LRPVLPVDSVLAPPWSSYRKGTRAEKGRRIGYEKER